MNPGGEFLFREKQREGLGKGNAGVWHADENFHRRVEAGIGNDGGGGALFGAGEEVFIFGEGEVAGFG